VARERKAVHCFLQPLCRALSIIEEQMHKLGCPSSGHSHQALPLKEALLDLFVPAGSSLVTIPVPHTAPFSGVELLLSRLIPFSCPCVFVHHEQCVDGEYFLLKFEAMLCPACAHIESVQNVIDNLRRKSICSQDHTVFSHHSIKIQCQILPKCRLSSSSRNLEPR
jgi:hypothetical protein